MEEASSLSAESQRVAALMDYYKKSKSDFAEMLGMSWSGIDNIVSKGRNNPSLAMLQKIFQLFPEVNPTWLFAGVGEMIKNQTNVGSEPKEIHFTSPFKHTPIPLVPKKAAAGMALHWNDGEWWEQFQYLTDPDYVDGTFACIEINGDSMSPTIKNNDWVICKKLDDPAKEIKDDFVYIIVSENGIQCKRVLNQLKTRQQLVIKSDNIIYPTDNIPAEEIIQIWEAKQVSTYNLRNLNGDMFARIGQLEAEVFELREEVKKLLAVHKR